MTLKELLAKNKAIKEARLKKQNEKREQKENISTVKHAEGVESKKETTKKTVQKGQKPKNREYLVVEDIEKVNK